MVDEDEHARPKGGEEAVARAGEMQIERVDQHAREHVRIQYLGRERKGVERRGKS